MISQIHQKLGTAGFIVAIVALIAALGGVAYAAQGLNSTQKKEVKKIAKKFAGKPGAPGPEGKQGPEGKPGAEGKEGKQGTQGIPGEEGKEGPEGSPWTAGGTLPSGKTETGNWAYGFANEKEVGVPQFVSLSFNIPLATISEEVHYVKQAEAAPAGCTGGTAAEPKADPGNLCIYALEEANVIFVPSGGLPHPDTSGALIGIFPSATNAVAFGSWAVTQK
jgi:hypothetical protein